MRTAGSPTVVKFAIVGPGFDLSAALTDAAEDMQIEDADEWLKTPQIQAYILMKQMGSMRQR